MEKLQWNLTKEQAEQFREFQYRQKGLSKILRALAQLEEEIAEQESVWWENVMLTNEIPKGFKFKLLADFALRKVWVKGKVPELDNSEVK